MIQPSCRSAKGYDRLARWYQTLEWLMFGRQLHRSRIALLSEISVVRRALFLGDGNGRLLKEFCLLHPECQVTSVDQSVRMLCMQQQAIESIGASDRVEFLQGEASSLPFDDGTFDLMVWPYFLDCFTRQELMERIPRWLALLRAGGCIYFADFVPPASLPRVYGTKASGTKASGLERWANATRLLCMHWLFRWQTGLPNRRLVDLPELLREFPLQEISERSTGAMMTTRLYQLTVPVDVHTTP